MKNKTEDILLIFDKKKNNKFLFQKLIYDYLGLFFVDHFSFINFFI